MVSFASILVSASHDRREQSGITEPSPGFVPYFTHFLSILNALFCLSSATLPMLNGDYARQRNTTITYYLWVCCIHCQLEAMRRVYCYITVTRSLVFGPWFIRMIYRDFSYSLGGKQDRILIGENRLMEFCSGLVTSQPKSLIL